jgi:hypothetical protein
MRKFLKASCLTGAIIKRPGVKYTGMGLLILAMLVITLSAVAHPLAAAAESTIVNTQPDCPGITIDKTADPSTYSMVGEVISYSYLVRNAGSGTFAGPVTVTDDKVAVSCPAGELGPYATMTCSASYSITQADLDFGLVQNTAFASANGTTSATDTETVTAIPLPALSILKTAAQSSYSAVGDVIDYSYLVKNTGNVTLAGPVTVSDNKVPVTCPEGGLAPEASMTCSASYSIVQSDLDSGSVTNTAQAEANGTSSNTVDVTVTTAKLAQTITFTSTAPALAGVGCINYTPSATATSGLPVTITVDAAASSVCAISGGAVTFLGIGTCVLDADQAGDLTYAAAPQVQQLFAVQQLYCLFMPIAYTPITINPEVPPKP